MRYGSLCSGVDAATVAWQQLGWKPAWFSEIDAFPSAVLNHHYPTVQNVGNMLNVPQMIYDGTIEAPDIVCGGTPCQAFSVAGLRQSLNDTRGNLTMTFCEVANAVDHIRQSRGEKPSIIFWENVPGVLSTSDNAFGCFLSGIVGESEVIVPTGKRWANAGVIVGSQRTAFWRILDAQYFGLAQRRKRVFVVASARDDIDIGQVLFEFNGMQRNSPPSRSTGKTNSATAQTSIDKNERVVGVQPVSPTLRAETKQSLMSGDGQINVPLACVYSASLAPTITASGPPYSRTGSSNQELDAYVVEPSNLINAMSFKVRGEGTVTGERNGNVANLGKHGGSGMISQEEKTFTLTTSQDQYIAYTMREDATNNTFSINETDVALTLQASQPTINSHHAQNIVQEVPVAFQQNTRDEVRLIQGDGQIVGALTAQLGMKQQNYIAMHEPIPIVNHEMKVRRLTPVECERLQGFPDNYTQIPYRGKSAAECPDSLRYRAIGNSWPVAVITWIGKRIQLLIESV